MSLEAGDKVIENLRVLWYSKDEKGKAREAAHPSIVNSCYINSRHMCEMWRLFSFSLEQLITQTDKGHNEYTCLY